RKVAGRTGRWRGRGEVAGPLVGGGAAGRWRAAQVGGGAAQVGGGAAEGGDEP
ncbi:unnamed protein product, partial [Closterium sp. Naga37s-1]